MESGICYTWPDCQKHVIGICGSKYKKFSRLEDAQEFIGQKQAAMASSSSSPSVPVPFKNSTMTDNARMVIYTDGSAGKHSGYGVYFSTGDSPSLCGYVEQDDRYKNFTPPNSALAEVYAILKAVQLCDDDIHIVTDNEYCYKMATENHYHGKEYLDLWSEIFANTKEKNMIIEWVRAHSGIRGNDVADQLASIGANLI